MILYEKKKKRNASNMQNVTQWFKTGQTSKYAFLKSSSSAMSESLYEVPLQ